MLAKIAPEACVRSIPTGVDVSYFTPDGTAETPGRLVFVGAMDWYPNEDAALHLIDAILPLIRREQPDVSLCIVGRNPSARVLAAAAAAGVEVTGTVNDVRPHIAEATVLVVPIRVGGGTRLKIFEALAMAKAVVSTTIGAEGLPLTDGEHLLLADIPRTSRAQWSNCSAIRSQDQDRRRGPNAGLGALFVGAGRREVRRALHRSRRRGALMKIRSLQGARGVATLLVVAAHMSAPYGIEQRYLKGPRLTSWMHLVSLVSIDVFFVISGAVITITTWHRFSTEGACRDFIYRRVTRIYPPYWIATAVVLVIYLVRPHLVNSHSAYPPQIASSFLILPQRGDPLVGVGWTLVYELYFYAIFAIALLFARRWLPWIIGAWVACTVIIHLTVTSFANPYVYVLSNVSNVEFVLGAIVGYLAVTRRLVAPRIALASGVATVTGTLAYLYATGAQSLPSPWLRLVSIGLTLSVVIYALFVLELEGRLRVPDTVVRLGDASYSIYLWHVPVMTAAGLVLVHVLPHAIVVHILAVIAVFAVAVLFGLWLYAAVERPMLRAFQTRKLIAAVAPTPLEPGATAPRLSELTKAI